MSLLSARQVESTLRKYGITPSKRKGQSCLVDADIARRIVKAAKLGPTDSVLEIGGGLGILTKSIAEEAGKVYVIEIDPRLVRALQDTVAGTRNVEVVYGDALRVQLPMANKCVSNLPYSISSDMTFRLWNDPNLEMAVLMYQREYAHRLLAEPGSNEYSRLTVEFSTANFGHPLVFGGDERSSDIQNVHKHQAFKVALMPLNTSSACPADVYFRYHAASNPMDRASAFHSYEIYFRDCQGGVTFRQGVYWVGYPEFRSQRMSRFNEQAGTLLPDGSVAPGRDQFILSAPDNRDWFGLNGIIQTRCEQWYAFAGPIGGEYSITICAATTRFKYDEHLTDVMDMTTWDLTGATGLGRRFEFSLYGPDNPGVPTRQPLGWFCMAAKPKEDKNEGPSHRPSWDIIENTGPACPTGYLPQFTAATFPKTGISFQFGNTMDKTFPGEGIVTVPN